MNVSLLQFCSVPTRDYKDTIFGTRTTHNFNYFERQPIEKNHTDSHNGRNGAPSPPTSHHVKVSLLVHQKYAYALPMTINITTFVKKAQCNLSVSSYHGQWTSLVAR